MVGLADELHVDVLDAVVHHLHVVPGAVRPDVGRARYAARDRLAGGIVFQGRAGFGVHLGGDGLPDRLEVLPRVGMATRHQRRAEAGADLPTADAGAEEAAAVAVVRLPANRVRPLAVATV